MLQVGMLDSFPVNAYMQTKEVASMMAEPSYTVTVRVPASIWKRLEDRTGPREKNGFIVRAISLLLSSMDAVEMEAQAREEVVEEAEADRTN